MSNEDQVVAVGRLALERAEAKRQLALIQTGVDSMARDLGLLGKWMSPTMAENYDNGLKLLSEIISRGGLEKLKSNVESAISLRERIADLDKRAKEAGID